MKLTAGSAYSGVIEQYHEVNGFILASRPASIRVIGQAPVVGKNIFDMVSNGTTFSIYIPSKNKFIVGPANLERRAEKPIENLRPQHLVDAVFWPVIAEGTPVLFEEASEGASRFYMLTVVKAETAPSAPGPGDTGSAAPGQQGSSQRRRPTGKSRGKYGSIARICASQGLRILAPVVRWLRTWPTEIGKPRLPPAIRGRSTSLDPAMTINCRLQSRSLL